MLQNFLDLEKDAIKRLVAEAGLKPFRANQLYAWQSKGIADFSEMTNLSAELREQLAEEFYPGLPQPVQSRQSTGGKSAKYLFSFPDGEVIEAVLMEQPYGLAACLSSQIGCAMGCTFCASTGLAFKRNLSRGELLGQFFQLEKLAQAKITNLDLMGIGEPLANYREVVAFLHRLIRPDFRDFAGRKICLSTCGLVDEIYRLAQENIPLTLSISLHAPNQSIREQLMPIARKYPYDEVLQAAAAYFAATGRRVSYEYALFKDINDQPEHAFELAKRLRGQNCHVNLIPGNRVPASPWQASSRDSCQKFQKILEKGGVNTTLRRSLGQDIEAACGQLRRSQLPQQG